MLLGDVLFDAVLAKTDKYSPVRVLTYLANGIEVSQHTDRKEEDPKTTAVRQSVPYSIISATESKLMIDLLKKSLGADNNALDESRFQGSDWVVINSWLASQIGAKVGDQIKVDYFLPETVEGEEVEKSFFVTVAAIAPLTEPKLVRKRKIWEDSRLLSMMTIGHQTFPASQIPHR